MCEAQGRINGEKQGENHPVFAEFVQKCVFQAFGTRAAGQKAIRKYTE